MYFTWFIHSFLNIFAILGMLALLIGGHEWAHFYIAKKFGVKALRFAIGFGKTLWRWHGKDGTEYTIGLIPLGGYVKFLDQREAPVATHLLPYAFDQQPLYKRSAIVLAGPLFNLLLALFVYWIIFIHGITQPVPTIGKVLPHSPASYAQFQPNQQILAINHHATPTWEAVIISLLPYLGENQTIFFTLQSSHGIQQKSLVVQHWQLTNNLRPNLLMDLGIVPWHPTADQTWPLSQLRTRQYSPWFALSQATHEVMQYIQFNLIVLQKLFTHKLSFHTLMGPLGLLQTTALAAHQGFILYLALVGFISIGLAVINLLPVPGLDGSHLCYFLIEKIRRKPVNIATQVLLFKLGIIVLSIFMVQTLMNDLQRLLLN